nr:2-hydroxycarboxylate transporter family protein [Dietzia kunjamensis]
MPMWIFLPMFLAIALAVYTETFPSTLISGFALATALGLMLMWIGQQVPILKDFGLPIILALFMPAVFVWQGWIPQSTVDAMEAFTSEQGAWDFILVAIITGAMLGMPRQLIIKAGVRFAVPVIGTIIGVLAVVGLIGAALGYGFSRAIFFVAAPVMAGGLPIGAIPMSEMYAQASGGSPADYLSLLISAVLIANVVCVVFAAVLNGIGKRSLKSSLWFCGNGQLLRVNDADAEELKIPEKPSGSTFIALGQGLLIAGTLYIAASMLSSLVPDIHTYAWLTFIAAAIKIAGFVPNRIEEAASQWGDYATLTLVPALLASVSIAAIDIGGVVEGFTDPAFIALILLTVAVSGLIAGALGLLVKFYFVETAIVPGFVMADTGGSGDVAVLSAGERMHLLPFATVATRLGGAFLLVLTSSLIPILGNGVF